MKMHFKAKKMAEGSDLLYQNDLFIYELCFGEVIISMPKYYGLNCIDAI